MGRRPRIGTLWLLSLAAALPGCRPAAVEEQLPIAVQVTTVAPQTFTTEMRYSATVKELQKVDLSFKVPGTVQELYQVSDATTRRRRATCRSATPCRSGTVLAQLDDADYRRKWNAAQEQLAKAESQRVAAVADADLAAKDLSARRSLSLPRGRKRRRTSTRPNAAASRPTRRWSSRNGTWRRPASPSSRPRTISTTAH